MPQVESKCAVEQMCVCSFLVVEEMVEVSEVCPSGGFV